jgi:TQXA domain-containing protein
MRGRRCERWARAVAVLAVLAAPAAPAGAAAPAETAPAPPAAADAPRIGAAGEARPGESFSFDRGSLATKLFPVRTRADREIPDVYAYCVESRVDARFMTEAERVGWDEFPGSNRFTQPEVRAKVGWILTHSHPRVDLDRLGAAAGAAGLTEEQAIAATQGAIWHFTDDRQIGAANSANVSALYAYLTGPGNTGLPEDQVRPTVELTAPGGDATAGTLAGPVVVSTNQESVAVRVETSPSLDQQSGPGTPEEPIVVGADGEAVDLEAVGDGEELWVRVPIDAPAGSATFTATAKGLENQGSLLVTRDRSGGHGQTLILVDATPVRADSAAAVSWEAAPVTGDVAWTKTDPDGSALAGSQWEISGPGGWSMSVSDNTGEGGDAAADADPAPGAFRVEGLAAGEYRLREAAAPEGFVLDGLAHGFEVAERGATVDLGPFANTPSPPPAPPSPTPEEPTASAPGSVSPGPRLAATGAGGAARIAVAGLMVLVLGGGAVAASVRGRMF